jgi:hypothetical protein
LGTILEVTTHINLMFTRHHHRLTYIFFNITIFSIFYVSQLFVTLSPY